MGHALRTRFCLPQLNCNAYIPAVSAGRSVYLKKRREMNRIVDLHIHTVASDGTDTPEELLAKIRDAGICVFSITDHDGISSCTRMRELLGDTFGMPEIPGADPRSTGQTDPIFLPGVEFSCEDEKGKYHILGYGYRTETGGVFRTVEDTHARRMRKLDARLDFIREQFGFVFSEEDLDKLHRLSNPGKPHIGNLMVQYGYAPSRNEAIKKYLNQFTTPDSHIRPEEAVSAILEDSGIPVLAHPIYGDGDQIILGEELDERVRRLKDFGLMGLECYYSGFVSKEEKTMLKLADKYDMLVTAGSDYHGRNKLIQLGDTGYSPDPEELPRLQAFLTAVFAGDRS